MQSNIARITELNQIVLDIKKHPDYITVPKKYKDNDIIDENMTIKENHKKIKELNAKREGILKHNYELLSETLSKIQKLTEEDIQKEGFSTTNAEKIYNFAYAENHSSGCIDVYNNAIELTQFIKTLDL